MGVREETERCEALKVNVAKKDVVGRRDQNGDGIKNDRKVVL